MTAVKCNEHVLHIDFVQRHLVLASATSDLEWLSHLLNNAWMHVKYVIDPKNNLYPYIF